MNRGFKAAFVAMLIMVVPAAGRAVDVKAGNWDLSFSGNVNAFATWQRCEAAPAGGGEVILGLACQQPGGPNQFSIESGLLPSAFVFTAKTTVGNIDTSATIGIYPGLHVADTRTGAGSNNKFTADVRQNFVTFGNKAWGTVKLGKDIGVFGSDAILSDMLLFGVGAGAHSTLNHNVTIGHIGTGYIYADWIPQVTYYSPSFAGAQLTVSVVEAFGANVCEAKDIVDPTDPDDDICVVSNSTGFIGGPGNLNNNQPGLQARLSYDLAGPVTARAWVGGLYQHADTQTGPKIGLDSYAGEVGVKASASGVSGLLYGWAGDGIGTVLQGALASNGVVAPGSTKFRTRKSYGLFGQVTAEIPGTKLKPGVSYGKDYLDRAKGEAATTALVSSNSMFTGALFYALTPSLTLTAEFDHLRSKAHNGDSTKSNTVALGGIMFF